MTDVVSALAQEPGVEPVLFNPLAFGRNALRSAVAAALALPGRALTAAGDLQRTGDQYDPAPAVDTAMMMVGAPGVPRGALGSSMRDPLFHGSPFADLTHLQPSTRGPLGPGVYTSDAKGIADMYGNSGHTYELPAKDRDIFRGHGHRTDEQWFGFKADKERLLAAAEPEKRAAISEIMDKMWSGDGYPMYQQIARLYGGDAGAQALYKKAGFEGLSGLVDGPEVLLFNQQDLRP